MNMREHIHQSNLIEGYDDEAMDEQGLVAWARLKHLGLAKLSHSDIKKTQKIATLTQTDLRPDWRGHYRKIPVYIGTREGAPHGLIPAFMDNWLIDLKDMDPKEAHVRFEHIHPFVDGNGRTGRLLMWWMEDRLGRTPTLIKDAEKWDYYGWF